MFYYAAVKHLAVIIYQCLDKISDIFSAIENPWFKDNQRSTDERFKKLLKPSIAKRGFEGKALDINREYSELDNLSYYIKEQN